MKFIDNKYSRWYFSIINAASAREKLSGYTERHHIMPKSLGGSNKQDNLVQLTAREHFICHWLLTRMVTGQDLVKMAFACKQMMHMESTSQPRYKISSRIYENLRIKLNMCLKEREFSEEWKKKLKESAHKRTDNIPSELREFYSKKLIALNKSRTGVKKPFQSGKLNCFSSEETKEKIKLANVAKYGVSNPSLVPYTCEHCGKSGSGLAGYHRWHGNNCRSLITATENQNA